MSLLMGVVFLAATIFALWSMIRAFSKSRRKTALRNLGIAAAVMVISPAAGVYFQNQEDTALGWRSSTDKRVAGDAGVTTASIWYEQIDAVERERAAKAAAAAEEQAAQEAAAQAERARIAEEERVVAAAEAERLAAAEAEAATVEDAACREKLSCWAEEHLIDASLVCDNAVENLANYDFEWTDGFLGMKFTHFRWKDQEAGVVTYIGDQIKFQNGFGAMQNHIYECDYDTIAERPIEVRAEPGRLQ